MRRLFGGAAGLALALACGGLPAVAPDEAGDAPEAAPEPPVPADVAPAEPAPAPEPAPPPESLFAALDPAEAPPSGANPPCPAGSSTIRHPVGGGLEVYCAGGNGRKQGPLWLLKGGRVVEVVEYADGAKSGRALRWAYEGKEPRKVAEEHWAAGQRDGDAAEWDPQGRLLARGKYAAGAKSGKFIENTAAADGADPAFGGRCYDAGAEAWATTDPAEFVTRACP